MYQNRGCNHPQGMVAFLDIGQGDAVYIQSKYGQSILVDTGNKDSGVISQIQKVTLCHKVHIDNLLLTHPDQDHIGEAHNLIQKGYVNQVIHNGFLDMDQPDESLTENNLEKIIDEKHIAKQNVLQNQQVNLPGFDVRFLYPIETPYAHISKGKKVDDNDYSIVFKLSFASTSFMLTGDAPIKAEKAIIKKFCPDIATSTSCPVLESTVLKLGHHGSKNSSGIDFLHKVNAEDYIVSAGLNNKYHHPNEETIHRILLNKKDSRIRETFLEGNIAYILD